MKIERRFDRAFNYTCALELDCIPFELGCIPFFHIFGRTDPNVHIVFGC